MVLVPAPARITSASLSAASNTARSTLVLRTTSPSTPAIRAGSSAVVSAGSTEQRCPRDSSSAMVWSATESANSRCMGRDPFIDVVVREPDARPCRSQDRRLVRAASQSAEDDGAALVEQHASLRVPRHGPGQCQRLGVPADGARARGSKVWSIRMTSCSMIGPSSRSRGHVVGGGPDELDAAVVGLVVGLGALEPGQERVVDVDGPARAAAAQARRRAPACSARGPRGRPRSSSTSSSSRCSACGLGVRGDGTWWNGRPAASAIGRRSSWLDTTATSSAPRLPAAPTEDQVVEAVTHRDTMTSTRCGCRRASW